MCSFSSELLSTLCVGESGLIICLAVGLVAFVLGKMKGFEDEFSRIRDAFTLRGYTRGEFSDILEKHEQRKNAAALNAKNEKNKS